MSDRVLLAHGGGGHKMARLLRERLRPVLGDAPFLHDGAVLPALPAGHRPALTTDGFVVRPLVFPGGDIGRLAVCGTVNDLAMTGARPLSLTLGLVLEEGLPFSVLERVLCSVRDTAAEAGVAVVTGDTKVVERGAADGLYVTTAGLGAVAPGVEIGPWRVRAGDRIWVSGDVGRHGAAILAQRAGLAVEIGVESDCAPLWDPVVPLLPAAHCLRDCTRGGLGAALVEVADGAGLRFTVDEGAVPVIDRVRGACELLGLSPLHLACEGRFLAVLPEDVDWPAGTLLGQVSEGTGVRLRGPYGTERPLMLPSGEQLPRIC